MRSGTHQRTQAAVFTNGELSFGIRDNFIDHDATFHIKTVILVVIQAGETCRLKFRNRGCFRTRFLRARRIIVRKRLRPGWGDR